MSSLTRPNVVMVSLAAALLATLQVADRTVESWRASFIVQADTVAAAAAAVESVGGAVTHRMEIIDGVGAVLSKAQREALSRAPRLRALFPNRSVEVASASTPQADFPMLVSADVLHLEGISGAGVTVAVLDSGIWSTVGLTKASTGGDRYMAAFNASMASEGEQWVNDDHGHGTHVSSIIVNSDTGTSGRFNGIAPDANLIVVQAFDSQGQGTYLDVIVGLDWILSNRQQYGIRVANLSFSGTPVSHYWDDPMNQAVMALWHSGIAVVASAGNSGPQPMTVGVPGNIPYVITVGAISDAVTDDQTDDFLASFSAAGPTAEGFVKPEIVAPADIFEGR